MTLRIRAALVIALGFGALSAFVVNSNFGSAFTGPSSSGGVGTGALGVDSANNISVGTSTTVSDTKLFVLASSTGNIGFAMKVFQPGSGPLFLIRNDGTVGIGTTIPGGASTSTLIVGGNTLINGTLTASSLAANLNASNISAGLFGAGNFAFPSSLGIATTTQVSLPAQLSVYGNGYVSGSLGIGTSSPQGSTLLSVGSATTGLVAVFGGGSGKIDVGTIDPPYTINGKSYATYLSAMIGVKEETTGVVPCRAEEAVCTYVIDFRIVPEASDLWLFSKTTNLKNNFDKMTVLLTPEFEGTVWYKKDSATRTLTLYAKPVHGGGDLEISYRLTAPRFDAEQWPNNPENGSPGFIIED